MNCKAFCFIVIFQAKYLYYFSMFSPPVAPWPGRHVSSGSGGGWSGGLVHCCQHTDQSAYRYCHCHRRPVRQWHHEWWGRRLLPSIHAGHCQRGGPHSSRVSTQLILRKITIWLSKNCSKLDIFFKKLQKIVIFWYWQFCWKKWQFLSIFFKKR